MPSQLEEIAGKIHKAKNEINELIWRLAQGYPNVEVRIETQETSTSPPAARSKHERLEISILKEIY